MCPGRLIPRLNAIVLVIVTTAALFFSAFDTHAADAERGQLLYENHCTVCHTSVVHIRDDRKSNSREEIRNWVQRWQKELGLQWSSGEIDDVVAYLDERYYKLKIDS